MTYLSTVKWSNLAILTLCSWLIYSAGNKIGNKGCKNLSRASLINLHILDLSISLLNKDICLIESAGVLHLVKAQWA
jgi:hypothetical protein